MILVHFNKNICMEKDNKKPEEKLASTEKNDETQRGKEHIDPIDKKETMEERAKREGWTDIAESHLGIDE
jgi:hypothetical protein